MTAHHIPGHLYGPPVPHIVFHYGDRYLGEVRGHPLDMAAAYAKVERHICFLVPGVDQGAHLAMLKKARAVLICGPYSMALSEYLEPYRKAQELEFVLKMKGYSRAPVVDAPKYVLTVILSNDGQYGIGIVKNKGPEQVIGKITFPGGRVEPGENLAVAAARELHEETGVLVDPSQLINIANSETMAVFAARSSDVLSAITREDEEVVVLALERHKAYFERQPDAYVKEFRVFLQAAEAAL